MGRASDYYTVPKSEAGVNVPIFKADGTESGDFLTIIGPDSKRYGSSFSEMNRAYATLKAAQKADEGSPEVHEAMADEILRKFAAEVVIGWSFTDEFSPEALDEFLKNAPAITREIPNAAGDRSRFFGLASTDSTTGQTKIEGSAEAPTDLFSGRERKSA